MRSSLKITVGGRGSRLSQAQVWEVQGELSKHHLVEFEPYWITTTGDKDLTTSLRSLEKTDFFTREIDELQLQGQFRISIHSAKDLPEPLRPGLTIVALTQGVDSSDSLLFNIDPLPYGAIIGTSSQRREENLRQWRSDLRCVDVRGNIDQRIALVDEGKLDGLVIAEAALIRLGLTHRRRMKIDGAIAQNQGRLAVIAREEDTEMRELFKCIDTR
ncbi:MAG: hydroxymethylbilane synthase [Verrucomicrobia bacterium]|nr:hydroxymethylbilane synthase [Verrucomicrobiota bacterium]